MAKANMEALDSATIKITLPDGMSVEPGKKVPAELLDVLAGYFKLLKEGALGGAEGCSSQSGCTFQVG